MRYGRFFFNTAILTAILFTIINSPVYAQDQNIPDELAAIYDCKSIENGPDRLSCYDSAVGKFKEAEQSGQVVTVDKEAIETVERDAFGFNIPSLSLGKLFGGGKKRSEKTSASDAPSPAQAKPKASAQAKTNTSPKIATKKKRVTPDTSDVTEVLLTIDHWKKLRNGRVRFYMTNGQVWEQISGSGVRVPKVRNNTPNTAKITKASIGSFLLRVNGKGSAGRVKRVY